MTVESEDMTVEGTADTVRLKRLSGGQLRAFHELGWVGRVSLFDAAEVREINRNFDRLCTLLRPDELPDSMNCWERHNSWLYEVVMEPRLLDCVEALLGRSFYQWGSHMMCKTPGGGTFVPWHQDAGDFPLSPYQVVSLWLAFDVVGLDNAPILYFEGSQQLGRLPHVKDWARERGPDKPLFPLYLPDHLLPDQKPVPALLEPGEASLHGPLMVHGSEANHSQRRRCGMQITYAASNVQCDVTMKDNNGDWSHFAYFHCRGTDLRLHPHAVPPTDFGRGPSRFMERPEGLDR